MNRGAKHRDHRDNDCRDNAYTDDFDRASTKRQRKDESTTTRRSGTSPSGATSSQLTAVDSYYKTLVLSQIDSHLSDEEINTMIYRELKNFGDFNVSLSRIGASDQRLAYVDFRYPENAKDAKHAMQAKLVLGQIPIRVESVNTHGSKVAPQTGGSSQSGLYRSNDAYRENSAPIADGRVSKDRFDIGSGKDRFETERYDKLADNGIGRKDSVYSDNLARLSSKDRYKNDRVFPGHRDYVEDRAHPDGPPLGGPPKYNNKVDGRYSSHHHHQQHLYPEDDESATRTLFVGNLERDITEDELRNVFQQYGRVEDIDIKRSTTGRDGGWSGGRDGGGHAGNIYSFIRFENLDMAHTAKVEMIGRPVRVNTCKIGYGKATPSTCVWVGGIGPWVSQDDVVREINKFVSLVEFSWPRSRNYAYALFNNVEEAMVAMRAMRGRELGGAGRRVRVDFADVNQMKAPSLPSVSGHDAGGGHVDFPGQHNIHVRNSGNRPNNDFISKFDRDFAPDRFQTADQRGVNNNHPVPPYRMFDKRKLSPSFENRVSDNHQTGYGSNGNNAHSRADNASVLKQECSVDAKLNKHLEDATSFADVTTRAPAVWTGALTLKNSAFTMRMHLLCGDERLVDTLMISGLPGESHPVRGRGGGGGDKPMPMLKVGQRLRMDAPKLEEVRRRMSTAGSHGYCVLLALPGTTVEGDTTTHLPEGWVQRPLKNLVLYLKQKEAAGIVSLPPEQTRGGGGVVAARDTGLLHAFPSGEFALQLLTKYAPRISPEDCARDDHLVVLVVRV